MVPVLISRRPAARRLARVLLAADDLRALLPEGLDPLQLGAGGGNRRLRDDGKAPICPLLDDVRHVPPVHGDDDEIRPEGKPFFQGGCGGRPGPLRHQSGLFLGAAKKHGPEQVRVSLGDSSEIFGPVTGPDNQIRKHTAFPPMIQEYKKTNLVVKAQYEQSVLTHRENTL